MITLFRYEDGSSLSYWNSKLSSEFHTLSALSWFVLLHFLFFFNLTEARRDRGFALVPQYYNSVEVCHGFNLKRELVFYTSRAIIEERCP